MFRDETSDECCVEAEGTVYLIVTVYVAKPSLKRHVENEVKSTQQLMCIKSK